MNRARLLGNVSQDFASGLVVFLVALPLCLGIALASGAPLQAGLITGIVAGIIVGWLSGSELSVSGPAAGLTVIVYGAIQDLGSFEVFTTCVILSGLFQIILSLLKAGGISGLFPNSVVKGMLAAIGITIILKQIPHALGHDLDFEGDLGFTTHTGEHNTFTSILSSLKGIQLNTTLVTFVCLAVMIGWPRIQKLWSKLKVFPAALMTVIIAVVMNELFKFSSPSFAIQAEHLVQLPKMDGISGFLSGFSLPSFEVMTQSKVLMVAVTLALVGSIETLLCIEATDKLDPQHRVSNTDRELYAQGVGNIVAGLLGGLPMTSVIVRSSANVYSGAKSRLSAIFHGFFLLLSVLFLANSLNKIPLAALAAILFVVGYNLSSLKLFKDARSRGLEYLIPFVVTIVSILFTDLLTGVGIGFAVGIAFVIKSNHYGAITVVRDGTDYLIKFTKDVSFANKIFLRKMLRQIPPNTHVLIDGSRAMFIDRDIYDMLIDFQSLGQENNITVDFKDIKGKRFSLTNRRRFRGINGVPKTDSSQQRRVG